MKLIIVLTFILYCLCSSVISEQNELHLLRSKRGGKNKGGDQDFSSTNSRGLSNALEELIIGQEPSIISSTPVTSSDKKLTREQRQEIRLGQQERVKQLISGTVSRFEGKHLFENGVHKGKVDSFDALTSDPFMVKKYLVDLNRKLYKGGVLPHGGNLQFQNWIDKKAKTVTIIDADIDVLTNDIQSKFLNWKEAELARNGKLPDIFPNFKTDSQYKVTSITLDPVRNAQGDLIEVSVRAEQLNTRMELGTDSNGKLSHFEKLDPIDITLPSNKIHENRQVNSFTMDELQKVQALTTRFWKDIGVPANAKNILLNEQALTFKEWVGTNDADLLRDLIKPASEGEDGASTTSGICSTSKGSTRRKRSARVRLGGCAIFVKSNGEVDSVLPKEFVKEYKKADGKGKEQLADLAKNNIYKVKDLDHGADEKKMRKLIHLEKMKSHVASVESVASAQNSIKEKVTQPTNAVETIRKKLSTVKNNVKLSPSKVSQQLSNFKLNKGIAKNIGTMSNTLGKFFLAKTVLNGIIHGDTTSLAIVGGQVGYDVITKSTIWAGARHFSEATKVGKATKFIGKYAGPIGAAADISLSVWSLTKSVGRLNAARNQYERNDAIADIVSDSVDIAITATVTALSLALPPAAPIIIAVGVLISIPLKLVTALFKAGNEVARINSEIPLLESEKSYIFTSRFFDWFGTRQKDYLEYLMEEKAANDVAVQHNVRFLENNPYFLGIVFPSRTLAYDGGCRLTKRYCRLKNAWGCTAQFTSEETVGWGCDWNRPCSHVWGNCVNHWERVGTWDYDDFKCVCDSSSSTNFGYPRLNSVVDFRNKQTVFWERAVPKDVAGADFKCKPGSKYFQDYKLHQQSSRWEYLCQDAIALLQPSYKRNAKQTMLFDLDDGDDQVYLPSDDSTSNLFLMGNCGTKNFYGGSGRNEFLFNGKCSDFLGGILSGGTSQTDVITITQSFEKGQYINLNFDDEIISGTDGKLKFSIKNIEEINGRENEGDNFVAGCQLRKVALRGGNVRQPDLMKILPSECGYNLTLMMGSYANVESQTRQGDINIIVDNEWKSVNISLDVHPKNRLRLNVFFLSTASHQVQLEGSSVHNQVMSVTLKKVQSSEEMRLHLNFQSISNSDDQNQAVYFTESKGSPYSILVLSPLNDFVFYHTLPRMDLGNSFTRTGNLNIKNVFEITGANWQVIGGDKSDEFLLYSYEVAMIDGRGGDDTLRLQSTSKIASVVLLNLAQNQKFKSIENVYGAPGNPMEVTCACDTKLVMSLGGTQQQPDVIIIPGTCSERNLQIVAKGHSRVVISSEMGNIEMDKITLVAVVFDRFELETRSKSLVGLFVSVHVNHKNWKANGTVDGKSIIIRLEGNQDEYMKFTIKRFTEEDGEPLLTVPYIQLSKSGSNEPSGQLIIERDTREPKILYRLTIENAMRDGVNVIEGFNGISNMFQIISGTWSTNGGSSNNVFVILNSAQTEKISVNGGIGGGNTLILETNGLPAQAETYVVNLEMEEMGNLKDSLKGSVKNIHHILGRTRQMDDIYTTCDTKSVNGREGAEKGQEDTIYISGKGCPENTKAELSIYAGKYTNVKNTAENGMFTYYIPDLLTTVLELKASMNSVHLVKFGFNPWEKIKNIVFDDKEDTLRLKVGQGNTERHQIFKMYRRSKSEEYSNIIFEFHKPGTTVTSEISVRKDGVVAATFVVHGNGLRNNEFVNGLSVDINHFLINITEESGISGGGIKGGSTSGANQLWIFQLESSLDILDGGDCANFLQCTNYLHFADTFEVKNRLEIYLKNDSGSIKSGENTLVSKVTNFNELRGRNGNHHDKVTVFACYIKKVSEMEEIVIHASNDCTFDLTIEVNKNTIVWFDNGETATNNSRMWMNSTFHYRFNAPRSFDLNGSSGLAWLGPFHNYYLPFNVDDLESIWFDLETERINYSIDGEDYYHSMISQNTYDEQFYAQPTMITKDGFKLQVARDGSVMFSMGAGSSFVSENIRSDVIPAFENAAKKLEVTIIMQTDTQFIHTGHGNVEDDRNVLQNVGYCESHLVGGGANDTIYEIVELNEDVFIYPGFEIDDELEFDEIQNAMKQTLDLTDIVVAIRLMSGTKYVPKLERQNDDLVIKMENYDDEYPGQIYIVNGALRQVASRIQILLNNAIMDLVPNNKTSEKTESKRLSKRSASASIESEAEDNNNLLEWEIRPRPIIIPDGTVFSISKEDLEDGHDIRIDNTAEINANFRAVRNGTDLYFTNVIGSRSGFNESNEPMEITTVVVTDYFKNVISVMKDAEEYDESLNGTQGENQTATFQLQPDIILDVTVSLPGLSLVLNGTEVAEVPILKKKTENERSNDGETKKTVNVMEQMEISDWKFLLYEAEEQILEGMSDIPRVFQCEECHKDINWIYYYTAVTCVLCLIMTLSIIICKIKEMRKKRRYEPNRQKAEDVESVKLLRYRT